MKLQPASKKEVARISVGCAVGAILLITGFFVLSLFDICTFSYRIILGAVGGSLVAILNFTLMCLMVQNAAGTEDKKLLKAKVQASYNFRLFLQAGWILVAFLVPQLHVIAAAIPLLFPTATIYYLQVKGKLVPPSPPRKAVPPSEEDEDTPGPFEI